LADRITVLRDGKLIGSRQAADVTESELLEMMTGRKIEFLFPGIAHKPREKALQTTGLSAAGVVADVDFHAQAGEITGIAGLVGCGKSELIRAIYGLEPLTGGSVQVNGKPCKQISPALSLSRGVCYFPADRVAEGLALERPIRENVSLVALRLPLLSTYGWIRVRSDAGHDRLRHGSLGRPYVAVAVVAAVWLVQRKTVLGTYIYAIGGNPLAARRRAERRLARQIIERLQLRPPIPERAVAHLSGGNRQKVML